MRTRVSGSHGHLHLFPALYIYTDCLLSVCACMNSVVSQAQKGNGSLSQAGILSAWSVGVATQPNPTAHVQCCFELGVGFVCLCVFSCYHTSVIFMLNLRSECSSLAFEVCNVITELLCSSCNKYRFCVYLWWENTKAYCAEYKNRPGRKRANAPWNET